MNAAISKAQYDGKYEDKHYAPQARVYSQLLPKLMPKIHQEDVALLWISQIRKKMNVQYGDPDELAGGNAPKFYASVILKVARISSGKKDGERVSNKLKIEAVKNQIAPPFKKAEAEIFYGQGIDKERSLIWTAEKLGIVKKTGSSFAFEGNKIGRGIEATSLFLKEHEKIREMMVKAVKEECKW